MRRYIVVGRTETGPVRSANQDHILVGRFVKNRGRLGIWLDSDDDFMMQHGLLLCVADGVGGAAGGDIASKLALMSLERKFYGQKRAYDLDELGGLIRESIEAADKTIRKEKDVRPEFSQMSTTLSGVCLWEDRYIVFNAGDSRVYRWRKGFLKPLTMDDTVTAQAVRMGALTPEQAKRSGFRHTITSSLGGSLRITIKEGPELNDGDMLLICSDGLHDMVSHDDLERVLSMKKDVNSLINDLFNLAIGAGGRDNISAILLKIDA